MTSTDILADEGILLVEKALDEEEIRRLIVAVHNFYERFLKRAIENYSIDTETATFMPGLWRKTLRLPRENQIFKRWNIVADDAAFIGLIDHKKIFPIILNCMGPDIQIYRSELLVVPSKVSEEPYLHTDSGTLGQFRSAERRRPLMISVQYFLTDLDSENMGNFTYVPRSHIQPFPEDPANKRSLQTEGYVQGREVSGREQLIARAGDAVIFHHSLWHGVSENKSSVARKSIIFGYAPLFVRPYDYERQMKEVIESCNNSIQKRLLGDFGAWYWRPGCLAHPPPDQDLVIRGGEPPSV